MWYGRVCDSGRVCNCGRVCLVEGCVTGRVCDVGGCVSIGERVPCFALCNITSVLNISGCGQYRLLISV